MTISEERIRERAFQIWNEEGRPEGKDVEHWEKARLRLIAESRTPQAAEPPAQISAPPKATEAAMESVAEDRPLNPPLTRPRNRPSTKPSARPRSH